MKQSWRTHELAHSRVHKLYGTAPRSLSFRPFQCRSPLLLAAALPLLLLDVLAVGIAVFGAGAPSLPFALSPVPGLVEPATTLKIYKGAYRYDVRIRGGHGGHGNADIVREVAWFLPAAKPRRSMDGKSSRFI